LCLAPNDNDKRRERRLATERKRRYRALDKAGGAVLSVPIKDLNALIETLLELRWLGEHESEDRKQIAIAVGALSAARS
jgi:hypothetical protein